MTYPTNYDETYQGALAGDYQRPPVIVPTDDDFDNNDFNTEDFA